MLKWYRDYKNKKLEEQRKVFLQEQLELKEKVLREQLELKMASPIPWHEIIDHKAEDINIRMRWNPAYIVELRSEGFGGVTDVDVIKAYHAHLELEKKQRQAKLEAEAKRNSSEPWVEVIGESENNRGQLELRLDWNKAFIVYLKEHGITGRNEDEIINKWLMSLSANSITNNDDFN